MNDYLYHFQYFAITNNPFCKVISHLQVDSQMWDFRIKVQIHTQLWLPLGRANLWPFPKVGYKGIYHFLGCHNRGPVAGPVGHRPSTGQILTLTHLHPPVTDHLSQVPHWRVQGSKRGSLPSPSHNSVVLSESFQQCYQHLDLTQSLSFSTKACCFPSFQPMTFIIHDDFEQK